MKYLNAIKAVFQGFLLIAVELGLLAGLIWAQGWAAGQNWPTLARMALFVGGFAVFALPITIAIQMPYRKPAWLADALGQGSATAANLVENPYAGEEWRGVPAERVVRVPVRLENGETCWVTCELGDVRQIAPGERLMIYPDPADPRRAALAE